MITTTKFRRLLFLLIAMLGLIACTPTTTQESPAAEPLTTPITKPTEEVLEEPDLVEETDVVIESPEAETAATIESIEVTVSTTAPVTAEAFVSGYFPNGCWSFGEVRIAQEDMSYALTVVGLNNGGDMCTEALVPFEETVELPVEGMDPGIYTVTAGDQETTFILVELLESGAEDDAMGNDDLSGGDSKLQIGEAVIGEVLTDVDEAAGVVTVTVSGTLPDGCTNIHETNIADPEEGVIEVTVSTARDPEMMCTMALVDYEHSFEIELGELDSSELTVVVNGFEAPLR